MAREYKVNLPPPVGMNRSLMGLTDESIMPFGKYKALGTKMGDVPPDYLLWAWDEFIHAQAGKPVHDYIKKHFKRLEENARDYIPDIAKRPGR